MLGKGMNKKKMRAPQCPLGGTSEGPLFLVLLMMVNAFTFPSQTRRPHPKVRIPSAVCSLACLKSAFDGHLCVPVHKHLWHKCASGPCLVHQMQGKGCPLLCLACLVLLQCSGMNAGNQGPPWQV